ncbi:hypothetical protein A6763_01090 [Aeromonas caviae]|nr:hypothetical protein A6763_01090 [Aeromonas caviae]
MQSPLRRRDIDGGRQCRARRDRGTSRAITKAMAKKSCSTHSRLAALSHLPLSWQLLGCTLAGVPLSAWSSAEANWGRVWQLTA